MDSISNLLNISADIKNIKNKEEAKKIYGADNVKNGFFTCKFCGKKVSISDIKTFNTFLCKNVIDATCKDCQDSFNKEELCTVVCIGCNEVIAKLKPGIDPKTGFNREKNKIYHIEYCPKCSPEKFKNDGSSEPVKLIEATVYENKFGKGILV